MNSERVSTHLCLTRQGQGCCHSWVSAASNRTNCETKTRSSKKKFSRKRFENWRGVVVDVVVVVVDVGPIWPFEVSNLSATSKGTIFHPSSARSDARRKRLWTKAKFWTSRMSPQRVFNGHPRPLFVYFRFFQTQFLQKKLQYSISDCQSRREARWPLEHHHGPKIKELVTVIGYQIERINE